MARKKEVPVQKTVPQQPVAPAQPAQSTQPVQAAQQGAVKQQETVQQPAVPATQATQPQPTQKAVQTAQEGAVQPPKKKKKKTWLWILLGCGGCLLCVVLTIGGVLALGGWGLYKSYDAIKEQIVAEQNPLCKISTEADIRDAYDNFMTEEYQENNSYASFKSMIEDNEEVFEDCDLLLPEFKDLFSGGVVVLTADGRTTVAFTKTTESGKIVDIEIVLEGSGGLRLNDIEVSN